MDLHPLSTLFPPLDGAVFDALVEDIRTNGVQVPVVTHHGMILDGRNRWRAAEAAGVPCPTVPYEGTDPLGYVISLNLTRRHLDEGQRAVIAARLTNMRRGRPRADSDAPAGNSVLPGINAPRDAFSVAPHDAESGSREGDTAVAISQSRAADALGVSRRSVQRAAVVLSHGSPDLVAAVEAGDVPVRVAAKVARLPKDEQVAAAKKPRGGRIQAMLDEVEMVGAGEDEPEDPGPSTEEIANSVAAEEAERTLMHTLLDSDDALKASVEECKRLIAENLRLQAVMTLMQTRMNGLMNEKDAYVRLVKQRDYVIKKLEKKLEEYGIQP